MGTEALNLTRGSGRIELDGVETIRLHDDCINTGFGLGRFWFNLGSVLGVNRDRVSRHLTEREPIYMLPRRGSTAEADG